MVSLLSESSAVSFVVGDQCVELAPGSFLVHKSGLEFLHHSPCPLFRVLELTLRLPDTGREAVCSGVVVAAEPAADRHRITILFLDLP